MIFQIIHRIEGLILFETFHMTLAAKLREDFLPKHTKFIPLPPIREIDDFQPVPIVKIEEIRKDMRIFIETSSGQQYLTILNVLPIKDGKEVLAKNASGRVVKIVARAKTTGVICRGQNNQLLSMYHSF